jgi:hypothetical protein
LREYSSGLSIALRDKTTGRPWFLSRVQQRLYLVVFGATGSKVAGRLETLSPAYIVFPGVALSALEQFRNTVT